MPKTAGILPSINHILCQMSYGTSAILAVTPQGNVCKEVLSSMRKHVMACYKIMTSITPDFDAKLLWSCVTIACGFTSPETWSLWLLMTFS
jgi:hypothetical protein